MSISMPYRSVNTQSQSATHTSPWLTVESLLEKKKEPIVSEDCCGKNEKESLREKNAVLHLHNYTVWWACMSECCCRGS